MIPFQLVLWGLQAAAAACVIWGGVNANETTNVLMSDGEAGWFDIAGSVGPMVLAVVCWVGQWFLGKKFGLQSELYLAVTAWLVSPKDAAATRRLMTAIFDWLANRVRNNSLLVAKINELAVMTTQQWEPSPVIKIVETNEPEFNVLASKPVASVTASVVNVPKE